MINYSRVKELSHEMICVLNEMRNKVEGFKRRTLQFRDTLGDKISDSALSLAEDIARIADETERIIYEKTTDVGDFAETLERVENTLKNKADNI